MFYFPKGFKDLILLGILFGNVLNGSYCGSLWLFFLVSFTVYRSLVDEAELDRILRQSITE